MQPSYHVLSPSCALAHQMGPPPHTECGELYSWNHAYEHVAAPSCAFQDCYLDRFALVLFSQLLLLHGPGRYLPC